MFAIKFYTPHMSISWCWQCCQISEPLRWFVLLYHSLLLIGAAWCILGVWTCALALCSLGNVVRQWDLRVRGSNRYHLQFDFWEGLVRKDDPQVLLKQLHKLPACHGDLCDTLKAKERFNTRCQELKNSEKGGFLQTLYLTEDCTVPKDQPDVWYNLCSALVAETLPRLQLLFHSWKIHRSLYSRLGISTCLWYLERET